MPMQYMLLIRGCMSSMSWTFLKTFQLLRKQFYVIWTAPEFYHNSVDEATDMKSHTAVLLQNSLSTIERFSGNTNSLLRKFYYLIL